MQLLDNLILGLVVALVAVAANCAGTHVGSPVQPDDIGEIAALRAD